MINDKYNIVVVDDLSSGFKENIPYLPKNKLMIENLERFINNDSLLNIVDKVKGY